MCKGNLLIPSPDTGPCLPNISDTFASISQYTQWRLYCRLWPTHREKCIKWRNKREELSFIHSCVTFWPKSEEHWPLTTILILTYHIELDGSSDWGPDPVVGCAEVGAAVRPPHLTTNHRSVLRAWTNERKVFWLWTNERSVFRLWTNENPVFRLWTNEKQVFRLWTN